MVSRSSQEHIDYTSGIQVAFTNMVWVGGLFTVLLSKDLLHQQAILTGYRTFVNMERTKNRHFSFCK